jgi:NADH-quinone oxidoreductase subunit L
LLAWGLYFRRPQLPARIAEGLGGIYRAVAGKYYIDELYAALFVKPLLEGSTTVLWHAIDQGAIDGTVNGTAESAHHVSDAVRHMQSGNLRSYAGWVAAGGAVVIAYMVWMGVR